MPREISGRAEAQRKRMVRHRERLRTRGCPETDAVDAAVADAVAAIYAGVKSSGRPAEKLIGLLAKSAVSLLVSRGFEESEAVDRVRRRIGRRDIRGLKST